MVPSNALEIIVITSDLISIVHLRAELVVESGGWREVLELDCDAAFPFLLLPEPTLPLALFACKVRLCSAFEEGHLFLPSAHTSSQQKKCEHTKLVEGEGGTEAPSTD